MRPDIGLKLDRCGFDTSLEGISVAQLRAAAAPESV